MNKILIAIIIYIVICIILYTLNKITKIKRGDLPIISSKQDLKQAMLKPLKKYIFKDIILDGDTNFEGDNVVNQGDYSMIFLKKITEKYESQAPHRQLIFKYWKEKSNNIISKPFTILDTLTINVNQIEFDTNSLENVTSKICKPELKQNLKDDYLNMQFHNDKVRYKYLGVNKNTPVNFMASVGDNKIEFESFNKENKLYLSTNFKAIKAMDITIYTTIAVLLAFPLLIYIIYQWINLVNTI
ncbi:MAG: hypothetical protein MJ211_08145 [Bacteroidales bacterium]|nr:hypothetical protein [Bacteroidales bacterium]